ncbi:MAG: Acetyl xylan esterase [Verrucomicrobiales bacterium]|nr:Acetyl xylan esterase [Verrucomicrobiales bacterium]
MANRFLCSTVFCLSALSLFAAPAPRVLPEGNLPSDTRLEPLKDLEGYFPFTPPASKAEWETRAERVRRQILVSQGLWPMPAKTPLKPVLHGKIDRGEYTVEKVYFESAPGFFVTGNLYRPKNVRGKAPGVLFAHGHWQDARLYESTDAELLRELANGEERFEEGGKSRFQSMCVQLARMGCVVWQWDMQGDSDAQQFSRQLVHGFARQRPEMNTLENWGLFSPQAETHLESIMGLQTWNAVRSLDFLLSLPEIDPERIAMTGASGGGTQTMLLAAIDPRVKLSFPAVMVSTAMQGGCTCENACLLRIDTSNVEFAGLFAPKPQGMTTANDWTREMSSKGFPELQQLYQLLGAPDKVMLKRGEHFPHNYNAVSRSAFYTWLNKHFQLGQKEPVVERDYVRLKREELSVWDDGHPAPKPADPDFERQLLRYFQEDAQKQLAAVAESDPQRFHEVYGGALEVVLNSRQGKEGEVKWKMAHKADRGSWIQMDGLIRNETYAEELPAVFCYPKQWNGTTVVWLSGEGKKSLFDGDGALRPDLQKLVDTGATVLGVDLLYQGEFQTEDKPLVATPKVKNPREAAAYTFGYNPTVFVQRVHDVISVVRFVKTFERPSKQLVVAGLNGAGPWVAAARAQCGAAIDRAVIDTGGFRFGQVLDIRSPDFVPGGAKYGDLPGMLALAAPAQVWVAGETDAALGLVRAQYQAANARKNLVRFEGSAAETQRAALEWLMQSKPN